MKGTIEKKDSSQSYLFQSIALLIVLATVLISIAIYLRVFRIQSFYGPFRLHHWLGWIGTVYIAVVTPTLYIIKRKYRKRVEALINVHIIGNLISVMFVSIHFVHEITRPPQAYPDLGTGLILYVVMILLVITGYSLRFTGARKKHGVRIKFFHIAVTISFYLIIIVHILHGLNII